MAVIHPFPGLRYDPARLPDWGAVLGPPYDIVDAKQTARLKAASPYQIEHIETAAGGDEIAAAAGLLAKWRAAGVLVQDAPALYLHEHRFRLDGGPRRRLALFAAVDLTPWEQGDVLPHEWTMPGPRATRTAVREGVGADVSPLMAFVADRDGRVAAALDEALALPPLSEGTDAAGDGHTLRRIDDGGTIAELSGAIAGQPIYMADGHHRYESALAVLERRAGQRNGGASEVGRVLMGIVSASDPGLVVGATHRLIHTAVPADLASRLTPEFAAHAEPPAQPHLTLISPDAAPLHLTAEAGALDALPGHLPASWRGLAPAVLQYAILDRHLGIDEAALAEGQAVTYTHGRDDARAAVARGEATAAFIVSPPSLEQVFAAAEAGDRMPQKSTYFVPKLPTGLVLHVTD